MGKPKVVYFECPHDVGTVESNPTGSVVGTVIMGYAVPVSIPVTHVVGCVHE